jgi:uncharacterized protein YjbJ (UPF0337 family)
MFPVVSDGRNTVVPSGGRLCAKRAIGPAGRGAFHWLGGAIDRVWENALLGGWLMTWYQLAGDWQQFAAMVKKRWDKLTDADLKTFGGGSAQLTVLLQKKYGYGREQAETEIAEFSHNNTT